MSPMRLLRPIALAGLMLAASSLANAETYRVTAKTGNDKTFMHVEIRLYGDKKQWSDWVRLSGKHDSHGAVDGPRDYGFANVGEMITHIELDLERTHALQATDDWTPEYVLVEHIASGTRSLFTQFSAVGSSPKQFGGNPKTTTADNAADSIEGLRKGYGNPNVYVRPLQVVKGEVRTSEVAVTYAQFAFNDSGTDQDVMRFKETWGTVQGVAVSETKSSSSTLGLEIGWESPPTAAGKFDVRTSASWTKTFETSKSVSTENLRQSEFDWSFRAPPYAGIFRKIQFRVPFAHARYTVAKTGESRWIRTVPTAFKAIGNDELVQIPKRDPSTNAIVPVSWDMITKTFFPHMDDQAKNLANSKFPEWVQKGYVYTGKEAPVTKLGPPTEVKAATAEGSVTLTWTASASKGVKTYEVRRGTDEKGPFQVFQLDGLSFADSGLANGETYFYDVRAIGDGGMASERTATVSATPGKPIAGGELNPDPAGGPGNSLNGGRPDRGGKDGGAAESATAKGPDLVGEFKEAHYDDETGRINVRFLVKNVGTERTGAFTVRAFITKNKRAQPKKDIRVGFQNVPALDPGQELLINLKEKVAREKLEGMKVIVLLDTDDQVAEANEDNNEVLSNKTFGKGQAADKKKQEKKDKKGDDGKKGGGKKGGGKKGKNKDG